MKNLFLTEIKRNINEREELKEYRRKHLDVVSVKLNRVVEDSDCIAEFIVKTSFKTEKYYDNVIIWKVYVYDDDSVQSYFDGTEYIEL